MIQFILITGLIGCCLLGPLYAFRGKKMVAKKTVNTKVKPEVKTQDDAVAKLGTFQVSPTGIITQTTCPKIKTKKYVDYMRNMNAVEVSDMIRNQGK